MKQVLHNSDVFKALANNKRLEIVYLLNKEELSVSEIQQKLNLSQSNISQHLMALRNAKVVNTRRIGKKIYYSLSYKNFSEVSKLVNELKK